MADMPRYGIELMIHDVLYLFLFRWKQEYMIFSTKVIRAETFSPTFVGYTFQVKALKPKVLI